jgi:signal transduction histidine kinase
MAVTEPQASSHAIPGRKVVFITYAASVLFICLLAIRYADRLPPLAVGLGLAVYLLSVGAIAIVLLRRAGRRETRWHDVMPCYFSVQGRDLRIKRTNRLFRRDFGDRSGEYCYRVYKDADQPCPNCPVLATFKDGEIHSSEETVVTRDGKTAHVVVTSAPHYDSEGNIVGVVEMSTNITAIKELQKELDRTRADYQSLFDLVPCYISVQDRDYRIIECNDLVRRDFGDNVLGHHCYSIYKRCDTLCPDCVVEKSFRDGNVHGSEETTTTKDGRKIKLMTGGITRVMEVATDITQVKELEHELALVGRAVAGLAHRIKNILMGLEGGLFVMNSAFKKDDRAAIMQGWEMIERNVDRVSHIVKDLLYCSKKRVPEFRDDVSAEEIAREVHELFHDRSAREDIDLRLEVGATRYRTLQPEGIHSLITNLVTNAIDACRFDPDESKQRHTISLRCRTAPDGGTLIEVADDGGGIPKELGDRVFEDFFSTKGIEGTGLGLLIINRVVEEHGGAVTFDSQTGRGTKFTVIIPPFTAAEMLTRVQADSPGD